MMLQEMMRNIAKTQERLLKVRKKIETYPAYDYMYSDQLNILNADDQAAEDAIGLVASMWIRRIFNNDLAFIPVRQVHTNLKSNLVSCLENRYVQLEGVDTLEEQRIMLERILALAYNEPNIPEYVWNDIRLITGNKNSGMRHFITIVDGLKNSDYEMFGRVALLSSESIEYINMEAQSEWSSIDLSWLHIYFGNGQDAYNAAEFLKFLKTEGKQEDFCVSLTSIVDGNYEQN